MEFDATLPDMDMELAERAFAQTAKELRELNWPASVEYGKNWSLELHTMAPAIIVGALMYAFLKEEMRGMYPLKTTLLGYLPTDVMQRNGLHDVPGQLVFRYPRKEETQEEKTCP